MTQNDLSKAFANRVDSPRQLQDVLAIIANTLGPVGGAISAGLTAYATQKRLDNVQSMLDALRTRLEKIDSSELKEVLSADWFIHLCVSAIENAQKEHRESKRKLFGICLANIAASSDVDEYEISNHFLKLLDEIDELDIETLEFLCRRDKEWTKFEEIASLNNGTRSKEIVRSSLQKLASFAVIETKGSGSLMVGTNPVGLWYGSSYSITDTGRQFVRYLET